MCVKFISYFRNMAKETTVTIFFTTFYLIIVLPTSIKATKQNLFMVEKVFYCPNEHALIHLYNWTANSKSNIVSMNGSFEVTETLRGPISMELRVQRCNLQRTRCDMFPPVSIPEVCNSFNTPLMGPNFVSRVKPKLQCPIKEGNYTINNMELDLKEFAKIPFEESRMKPIFKFFVIKKNKKILAGCFGANVRLTISSSRKN